MTRLTTILLMTAGLFFFTACKKDTDVFIPDQGQTSGPDLQWYSSLTAGMPVNALKEGLISATITDSIEVNGNPFILNNSATGLQCTFTANCCMTGSGQPVTGKVYVELLMVRTRGDMIRNAKPSVNNGKIIVSGGQVFIKLKKGTDQLQFTQNAKVYVRFNDNPVNSNMKLFYGDESTPDHFNWLPFDTLNFPVSTSAANGTYEYFSNKLRWTGIHFPYAFNTSQGIKVADSLPNNFTNANTIAYLVIGNVRSVLPMYADVNLKKFIAADVPPGLQATVVIISKQANDFYLGHEGLVTGAGTISGLQQVKLQPVKKSLADIKAYLGTL